MIKNFCSQSMNLNFQLKKYGEVFSDPQNKVLAHLLGVLVRLVETPLPQRNRCSATLAKHRLGSQTCLRVP
jgi:hypothetical protein